MKTDMIAENILLEETTDSNAGQRLIAYGKKLQETRQKGHSQECPYEEDDLLLYAYWNPKEDINCLVSAEEMDKFERYFEYARKKDKDVTIDKKRNATAPYKIVYGGLMHREEYSSEEIECMLKEMLKDKGRTFLDMDSEENGNLIVSILYDIKLYPEQATAENFIPFAALMQTHHTLHQENTSVTLFPCTKDLVWEMMINKPFLLACRETDEADGLEQSNWQSHISEKLMLEKYEVAGLYCPQGGEDEDDN